MNLFDRQRLPYEERHQQVVLDDITLTFRGAVLVRGQGNHRSFTVLGLDTDSAEVLEHPIHTCSIQRGGFYAGIVGSIGEALEWLRSEKEQV